MTKGPIALFFGGEDIVPHLSVVPAKPANMSLLALVVLSPLLQLLVQIYKQMRFRKEIRYEEQLQHADMSGFRNVYGPTVIFLCFSVFFGTICLHYYFSEQNRQVPIAAEMASESQISSMIWMTLIFT